MYRGIEHQSIRQEMLKSYVAIVRLRSVIPGPRLILCINSGQLGLGCQPLSCQLCLEVRALVTPGLVVRNS